MTDHPDALDTGFPPDFAAFQAGRRRFLDRMSADAALWQALRDARRPAGAKEIAMERESQSLQSDLTVLSAERHLRGASRGLRAR